jgi:predicted nuclease with RNAse H fold
MWKMRVVGIDLAGLETNPSGFAVLEDGEFETSLAYSDEQIIELCKSHGPDLVAIDAPLTLPRRGNLRKSDLSLIRRGLRVFPPTFAGMRKLTERGMRLAKKLRAKKIRVIEVHPRTSGLILFHAADRARWLAEMDRLGYGVRGGKSRHEIDAVMAAMTGLLHLRRKTEEVGARREGSIVIPKTGVLSPSTRSWRGWRC